MIPKEIIDDIFSTARIEEVIGEFVQLKRSGSNLKGLSPFVNEKTPSFMVSPAKQIFKDFSSGKGGNVVSFLMEHEAMTYPEALKWLAKKYNIEVPEVEETPEQIAQRNERESLFIINGFAEEHFEHNLWENDKGRAIGLSYFKERGFDESTIKKFHLGYCLEDNVFHTAAQEKGYNSEHLLKLGLIKKNDKGFFDFFRGRVMFPIHNLTGRVVGFGGRTLRTDKKIAKYFNSPESEIYNKSNVLYGLYQAKSGIVKEDNCYLVEGYTDVISLAQAGVENVVSSSGTALTEQQIRLINRYTQNVTILYDGDAAGIKASFRGIDMILEQGLNVRVLLFPDGEDPDSFARNNSEEDLKTYLQEHVQDFVTFKTEILAKEAENDPIKKAKLIKEIAHSIGLIPDQITRSVYLKSCADKFDIEEQILISEVNKVRRDRFNEKNKSESSPKNQLPDPVQLPVKKQQADTVDIFHQEQELVRLLLNFGVEKIEFDVEDDEVEMTVATYIIEQLEMDELVLTLPGFSDIYQIFCNEINQNRIPGPEHFYAHHHPDISRIAVDLCSSPYNLSDNWWDRHRILTKVENENLPDSVQSAIFSFKMKRLDQLIRQSQEKLKSPLSDDEMNTALIYQRDLINARKQLAEIMGRTILK